MGIDLSAAVKHGDDVGTYSDFVQGRRLKDIKHEGLGHEVTKKALKYLGQGGVEERRLSHYSITGDKFQLSYLTALLHH